MLISKLTLITALGLTVAAYPTGWPDDTGFDASMALRPGGTSRQGPGEYDSSQSNGRAQRRPKPHPSKRDGPHPPHVNPSNGPGPHRVGNGGSGGPSSPPRLPPGAVPSDDQPRQYTKRHEGHDSEQPQGPPSEPSSGPKPDRTGPSYGDHSGTPERPDRDLFGPIKGDDHHEHDHLHDHNKPGKDGKDKVTKGKDEKDSYGKSDKPGKDGLGEDGKPDEASPTSKPSTTATPTSMTSNSAESTVSGEPTPSASSKPEDPAGSGY
ncbi:hypothetical protein E8E11_001830 [Didymella keratinophila]|nr:hypothetical protein E8E11_001830 [Didymella keratinophila]